MENFTYHNHTKIIYGRSTQNKVGEEVKKITDKILLHFGGGSIKRSGLYDTVIASLREHGVELVELGGVVPNPRLDLVRKGIEICRREKITLILAVGGGSVVDSAKAIAMGVPEENGDVWEVDEFMGANEGLVVAEIELESEEQDFMKPEWLGEEVSKVSRYLNVELSKLPYKAWTAEQKR